MQKLEWPTLFCNSLVTANNGEITGYKLRQKEGKMHAVKAFKSLNMKVFAAGDSFNDLAMITEADAGCLFRAPDAIKNKYNNISCTETYEELFAEITVFLENS